jgi:hypothetical protein
MMKTRTRGLLAVGLLAAVSTAAIAAGNYFTYPIVGSPAFCASSNPNSPAVGGVTGQQGTLNCVQTVPAGPSALTGNELIPADTGQTGSSPPQTVTIPSSLLGYSINRLIGGDMTTNLAQVSSTAKGVTSLATLSPTAAVITADRWWVIAPAAGVTVTIDSTAATAVIPGINNTKALRIARTTSGAAGLICTGQTLDKVASAPLIGNNAVFSFYESNGSGMSAANGAFTVNVDYTSANDAVATQATLGFAGANGSLFALGDVGLLSAGPTNMTRAIAGVSPGTTGTVAAGVATIPGSTTWTRYAVYAPIPIYIPGTTTLVQSVSVSICWAPVLTSGISTDWIEINGMQLEAKPSMATASLPAGVISPTSFDRRPAAIEQVLQQSYWYFNYEQQSLGLSYNGVCADVTTGTLNCTVNFPVTMRIVPLVKFTDGFQVFVQVAETSVAAMTGLALPTALASVVSTNGFMFKGASTTVGAAGTINQWMSLGTSSATGIISASAEP